MPHAKSEDIIAGKKRPFTGKEYLDSLDDGREVYIYGEQVKNVATHPAFRNAARTIARLYDALHDPGPAVGADLSRPTPEPAVSPTSFSASPSRVKTWSASAMPSLTGRGCPTAGWAARRTTRRR